jgi:hypothetical protein
MSVPEIDQYIVYSLIDPRDNELFYIGKTIQGSKRFNEHFKDSSLKVDGNTKKANKIRKLKKLGLKPSINILYNLGNCQFDKNTINTILYEKEQELIEFYKMIGYDLTNHQDGGPGSPNRVISEQTRNKMSKSAKKRGLNQALLNQQKSKFNDPEGLKICSICFQSKELNQFGQKNRHCKCCFNKNRKSRAIPGLKESCIKRKSYKIKAISIVTNTETIFSSMREAARIIGSTCNKTHIINCIKDQKEYFGYIWSRI